MPRCFAPSNGSRDQGDDSPGTAAVGGPLALGLSFQEFGHEVEHLTGAYAPLPRALFWLLRRRGNLFSERMRIISTLLSLRGDNLEKIGREFNIARFSCVSSVAERMRGRISGDRQLRNCVEDIKTVFQMSQAETLLQKLHKSTDIPLFAQNACALSLPDILKRVDTILLFSLAG